MRMGLWRCAGILAVSGLLCSASGCKSSLQSLKGRTAAKGPEPVVVEPAEDLTDVQVADIQSSLARTLEQRGDLKAAKAAWGQVLERDPAASQASWRMAVLTDRQGQFDKSEPYYRRAVKSDPQNVELLCDYGYSLYLQRRWQESERLLTRAAELDPENARVQNNLGLLYANTERMGEAAVAFQRAGCSMDEARTNMGVAAAMSGRRDEARRMFERALADNPESATAVRGLEALAAVEDVELEDEAELAGEFEKGVSGERGVGVRPASYSTR
jgi:Tfp pilus assembly protein PilF